MALVIDTGPIVAILDRDDEAHARCAELLSSTDEWRVIPSPVLPEVDALCRRHQAREAFTRLLGDVRRGAIRVEDLLPEDYERVMEILDGYRDLRVGFVDAAVLAIVERLGETRLATLDRRHFGVMRPRHIEALELLPHPAA
ncbi:MAG: PIN domain-containing protein [Thermoleophilia bacterium]|nr:PIN domain-containing protein [Thermoleophilia bacterium]